MRVLPEQGIRRRERDCGNGREFGNRRFAAKSWKARVGIGFSRPVRESGDENPFNRPYENRKNGRGFSFCAWRDPSDGGRLVASTAETQTLPPRFCVCLFRAGIWLAPGDERHSCGSLVLLWRRCHLNRSPLAATAKPCCSPPRRCKRPGWRNGVGIEPQLYRYAR